MTAVWSAPVAYFHDIVTQISTFMMMMMMMTMTTMMILMSDKPGRKFFYKNYTVLEP